MNKTLEHAVKLIGIPTKKWEGRCHEISSLLVKAGFVRGRVAYGHYYGPVSPNGFWKKRLDVPFQRHGWIVLKDGTVVDPTRWSFEAAEPYIAIIMPKSADFRDYDEGGNKIRLLAEPPVPCWSPHERRANLKFSRQEVEDFVMDLLEDPPAITVRMANWLGNLALQRLEPYVKDIYEDLVAADLGAVIPYDNRKLILGER